jgi:hypothetical protein
MRTITALVFAATLIALPATAKTSDGSGAAPGRDSTTSGATVGVGPSRAGTTGAASRSCDAKAEDCEPSLRGRYMQLVNEMARLACGRCANW